MAYIILIMKLGGGNLSDINLIFQIEIQSI